MSTIDTINPSRPEAGGTAEYTGPSYRIGDLAREFGVTLRTLRFYEDKGLIRPYRRGTTRIYSPADREQLMLALFCKRIGLPLKQIRTVLEIGDESDCRVRRIYEAQAQELHEEKQRLAEASDELDRKLESERAAA